MLKLLLLTLPCSRQGNWESLKSLLRCGGVGTLLCQLPQSRGRKGHGLCGTVSSDAIPDVSSA